MKKKLILTILSTALILTAVVGIKSNIYGFGPPIAVIPQKEANTQIESHATVIAPLLVFLQNSRTVEGKLNSPDNVLDMGMIKLASTTGTVRATIDVYVTGGIEGSSVYYKLKNIPNSKNATNFDGDGKAFGTLTMYRSDAPSEPGELKIFFYIASKGANLPATTSAGISPTDTPSNIESTVLQSTSHPYPNLRTPAAFATICGQMVSKQGDGLLKDGYYEGEIGLEVSTL